MMKRMGKAAGVVVLAVVLVCAAGIDAAQAQGPADGSGGLVSGDETRTAFSGFGLVCSTTNYTDVAAKALGMDRAALRQALVGGKTLQLRRSARRKPPSPTISKMA